MISVFSTPLFRYVFLAIRRDRIVQLMLLGMVLGAGVSIFFGGAATIEKQQFTVAFAATALRLVAVMGLIVFINFFVRRSFDSREIDYLLATPLTRLQLLFSFALCFIALSVILTTAISLFIFCLSGKLSSGYWLWCTSVAVELAVTSVMALFFSAMLRSATISTLCTLGFYSLSRMMGMMLGIITAKIDTVAWYDRLMVTVVKIIALFVPRFDLLAQSHWLVYGQATGPLWILPAQFLVFCSLFFVCALFDFRRNQF